MASTKRCRYCRMRDICSVSQAEHCRYCVQCSRGTFVSQNVEDIVCGIDTVIIGDLQSALQIATRFGGAAVSVRPPVAELRCRPVVTELQRHDVASMPVEALIVTGTTSTAGGITPIAEVFHRSRAYSVSHLAEMYLYGSSWSVEALHGLEHIPTLHTLALELCANLTDVQFLASHRALVDFTLLFPRYYERRLCHGLERISTLKSLNFRECKHTTNLSCLASSPSLTELNFSRTNETDDGLRGLERIRTLQKLYVNECRQISDVRCLAFFASLVELNFSLNQRNRRWFAWPGTHSNAADVEFA